MQTIKDSIKTITVSLITLSMITVAYAWTEPTSNPPSGNVSAPINTSITAQYKSGSFGVTTPGGYSQTLLQQWGLYSPGTMYIEPGQGSNLYLTDQWSKTGMLNVQFGKTVFESGNVGIGTTDPKTKLDVNGPVRVGQYSTKPTCDANTRGSIVFDTTNDKPYVCAASGVWKPLDSDGDKDGLIASFDDNDGTPKSASTVIAGAILSGYKAYGYSGGANGSWSQVTGTYTPPTCPACAAQKTLGNYCVYNTAGSASELPLISSPNIYSYSCGTNNGWDQGNPAYQTTFSSAEWTSVTRSNSGYNKCGITYFSRSGCTGNVLFVQSTSCTLRDRDNGAGGASCSGSPIYQSLPTGWDRH